MTSARETERTHGVDGWELEDYEWDVASGLARCDYIQPSTFAHETIVRAQPTRPGHIRWRELGARPQDVLTMAMR